eukprot:Hpha_TRINITY_DN11733_c0_g3::TRINITY_DN11733_c0_g3_i1::g.31796::m.31796
MGDFEEEFTITPFGGDCPIPEDSVGLTDEQKLPLVRKTREQNEEIASANEAKRRKVAWLREVNSKLKMTVKTQQLTHRLKLEADVKPLVDELQQLEAVAHAQRQALDLREPVDPGVALNHLIHLRGWSFPTESFKEIPVQVRGGRQYDYQCEMYLELADRVVTYKGARQMEKKSARRDAMKRLIMAQYPELESYEEAQATITLELTERRQLRGGGGGGGGRTGTRAPHQKKKTMPEYKRKLAEARLAVMKEGIPGMVEFDPVVEAAQADARRKARGLEG